MPIELLKASALTTALAAADAARASASSAATTAVNAATTATTAAGGADAAAAQALAAIGVTGEVNTPADLPAGATVAERYLVRNDNAASGGASPTVTGTGSGGQSIWQRTVANQAGLAGWGRVSNETLTALLAKAAIINTAGARGGTHFEERAKKLTYILDQARRREVIVRLLGTSIGNGVMAATWADSAVGGFVRALMERYGRSPNDYYVAQDASITMNSGELGSFVVDNNPGCWGLVRLKGQGANPLYLGNTHGRKIDVVYSTEVDGGSFTVSINGVAQAAVSCAGATSYGNIVSYDLPNAHAKVAIQPPASGTYAYIEGFRTRGGDRNPATGIHLQKFAKGATGLHNIVERNAVAFNVSGGGSGYKPDLLLISGPTNDPVATFEDHLTQHLDAAAAASLPVIFLIEPANATSYANGDWLAKREIIFRLASTYGAAVADWDFAQKELAYDAQFYKAGETTHPNDAGHAVGTRVLNHGLALPAATRRFPPHTPPHARPLRLVKSALEPVTAPVGTLWLDTSVTPNLLKRKVSDACVIPFGSRWHALPPVYGGEWVIVGSDYKNYFPNAGDLSTWTAGAGTGNSNGLTWDLGLGSMWTPVADGEGPEPGMSALRYTYDGGPSYISVVTFVAHQDPLPFHDTWAVMDFLIRTDADLSKHDVDVAFSDFQVGYNGQGELLLDADWVSWVSAAAAKQNLSARFGGIAGGEWVRAAIKFKVPSQAVYESIASSKVLFFNVFVGPSTTGTPFKAWIADPHLSLGSSVVIGAEGGGTSVGAASATTVWAGTSVAGQGVYTVTAGNEAIVVSLNTGVVAPYASGRAGYVLSGTTLTFKDSAGNTRTDLQGGQDIVVARRA